uniref:Uncharacterized protein n=1 Tax=Chromera velia CCMP2878 TaxID=1169474 RepID=A0A0G4HH48_9ALVE|eukprot:Cvel_27401.t1-p1 / transcript=Cvel_27401.t1 / gene=Cvel_27401 / organism=Chromera_velia_CCMP2878 / gene_product=hypothetical protein / transcript_product=hypothetical protein / location=Cvel_scaffold3415:13092-14294(-) / protein_length=401 / sequence_SO=supercontig / SO=protein_coding / is_pseudo=false
MHVPPTPGTQPQSAHTSTLCALGQKNEGGTDTFLSERISTSSFHLEKRDDNSHTRQAGTPDAGNREGSGRDSPCIGQHSSSMRDSASVSPFPNDSTTLPRPLEPPSSSSLPPPHSVLPREREFSAARCHLEPASCGPLTSALTPNAFTAVKGPSEKQDLASHPFARGQCDSALLQDSLTASDCLIRPTDAPTRKSPTISSADPGAQPSPPQMHTPTFRDCHGLSDNRQEAASIPPPCPIASSSLPPSAPLGQGAQVTQQIGAHPDAATQAGAPSRGDTQQQEKKKREGEEMSRRAMEERLWREDDGQQGLVSQGGRSYSVASNLFDVVTGGRRPSLGVDGNLRREETKGEENVEDGGVCREVKAEGSGKGNGGLCGESDTSPSREDRERQFPKILCLKLGC